MKKSLHSLTLFGLIILLISSCNTSSNLADSSIIKKRRYTKGFQVSIKGFQKDAKTSEQTAVIAEKVQATEVGDKQYADLAEASVAPVKPVTSSKDSDLEKASKAFVSEGVTKSDSDSNDELSESNYSPEKSWTKKEIRKNLRHRKFAKGTPAAAAASGESLVLYVILAIILPPLAVGLLYGIGTEFLISLILTIIFWLPGVIYALIKVFQQG